MNGNQGLEALATLCNNASMSNEEINVPNNERNRQHNQRVATNSPSTTSSSSSGLHLSGANVTSTAHQMSNFPPHVANVLKSMGPNLTAAQMGSLMANFGMLTSGIPPSNDQSSSLHQLAYANANNAPYMHPGMIPFMTQSNQNTSGGFPFAGVDPNTMNALIHASHMQNGNFQMKPNANQSFGVGDDNAMRPPQFIPSRPTTTTSSQPTPATSHQPILMRSCDDSVCSDDMMDSSGPPENKKLQKRAANRRSAQLSRKRKKQFIEELKEENDELRRKEQILRSIPDLIVVFDSSGKLGFVSHSVSNFLEFTDDELVGKSFWERLCEESVRLLKAAFMDALAARVSDSDTTPLGAGVWELRLQDKSGHFVLVTLNGVVHFSGDTPECVCSIRPMKSGAQTGSNTDVNTNPNTEVISDKPGLKKRHSMVKPEQSVVRLMQRNVRQKVVSDGDSTSVTSSE